MPWTYSQFVGVICVSAGGLISIWIISVCICDMEISDLFERYIIGEKLITIHDTDFSLIFSASRFDFRSNLE